MTPTYVSAADADAIEIKCVADEYRDALVSLGFTIKGDRAEILIDWDLKKATMEKANVEKAKIMSSLRDLGIHFSFGHGWSPSGVFQYLREKSLLTGKCSQIIWSGPGQWQVYDI